MASVSCIYGLGSPEEYGKIVLQLKKGETVRRQRVLRHLIDIQYTRNDQSLVRGTFRVRGDTLEIFPAYEEIALRIEFWGDEIERIIEFDPLTGEVLIERTEVEYLPGQALYHQRREAGRGHQRHRGRTGVAGEGVARTRARLVEAQRTGAAHPLRPGDAAGDGLLLRRGELLAPPEPPAGGRTALRPCSTTSPTTSC